uniref:Photolyase/cryptochrome alpha/beta domain-containing protein n=1 Tax=Araucaria cunninghamii TaxID=56994 RepID=A0A0D6R760_ARACU
MANSRSNAKSECTIVWFRRDLRVEDNLALITAARVGSVIPLYIWCPQEQGEFYPGRASRWWFKHSLLHLQHSLHKLGSPLVIMKTHNSLSALLDCARSTGATRIFYNHLYDPVSLVQDHKLKQKLLDLGFTVQSFNGDLLYEPWEVYDDNGQAFTTFDSYWRKCLDMPFEPNAPLLPPKRLVPPASTVLGCTVEELALEHEMEKSSNALLQRGWSPGWSNADKALDEFLAGPLLEYAKNKQKAYGPNTSLLSPHMHFGELSVRKVFHYVRRKQILWAKEDEANGDESVDCFLRAIGLREYSRYLCFNFPFTHERSLLHNLRFFPWRHDESYFKAWRQGRTGYPLVDAGMRELWATGWIHNRIRVVVSSFCVKFLQLPWTWGMKYFWDTLLDADIESDVLGWQYISGSLPDGHELDRMDYPEVQGYMFDPDGQFTRQWLPELARMPTEWIHHPWDAPVSILKAAGVELGSNYPRPVVETDAAREHLQQALTQMWEADMSNCTEGLGDTLEVRGTGGPLHETMVVPRVVVKREEVSSCNSWRDQRVPSIVRQEDSSPNNKWEVNPQISHQESKQVSFGDREVNTTMDKYDGLERPREQICLSKVENIPNAENDLQSTAESSSVRKRSTDRNQLGLVPSSSQQLIGSSLEIAEQEHASPDVFGKKTSKFEEENDILTIQNGDRATKRPCHGDALIGDI